MSLASWRVWEPLWPAAVVWLLLVLPTLAFHGPGLIDQDSIKLPLWLRALFWVLARLWPYSKVARFGAWWHESEQRSRAATRDRRCPVCSALDWDIDHALVHFPGEESRWQQLWWTPPLFATPEEADRWLAARAATGEDSWE